MTAVRELVVVVFVARLRSAHWIRLLPFAILLDVEQGHHPLVLVLEDVAVDDLPTDETVEICADGEGKVCLRPVLRIALAE